MLRELKSKPTRFIIITMHFTFLQVQFIYYTYTRTHTHIYTSRYIFQMDNPVSESNKKDNDMDNETRIYPINWKTRIAIT